MLPKITAFDGEEHAPFTLNGGTGAAILTHGFPGTPHEMRAFAHVLHGAGLTTHAPLLPGFGAQINNLTDYTYDDWLTHLVSTARTLRKQHQPLILVGHSMGGALSIAAATHLQPDGLILFAPFKGVEHILWKSLPVLRRVFPRFKPFKLVKPNFDDPNFRDGVTRFMPGIDLDDPDTRAAIKEFELPIDLLAHIHKAGQQAQSLAPKITCPTLVIQGSRDDLVTPQATRTLMQRMNGKLTYVEVDADHQLFNTDAPAWEHIRAAMLHFTQQVYPSATVTQNGTRS